MKWFYRVAIFLFLIPVQTLLLEKIEIGGVKPDLALVLVYCLGWAYGEVQGLLWGVALGGLIDLFSIGLLSVNFILKATIGFTIGMLGRSFLNLSLFWNLLIFFFISLLHDFIGTLLVEGMREGGLFLLFQQEMVGRALYSSLFAIGLLFLFSKRKGEKGLFDHAGIVFSAGGNTRSTE
jgi:rod shape-determining protein MreD